MGTILQKIYGSSEINEATKSFVDSTISESKVVMFSKSYCPYCKKAQKLFSKYSIKPEEYKIIELEKRSDCSSIQAYLKEITGASSVPRIFINGQCIGGCDDTIQFEKNGELEQLLKNCDAL